ncbi:MAG TPA: VWA domain-containing protein [Thermoanaerobaculia bacterium]|nr:VWA domain-containing protein [Thermoanaerobaculia bacterium]
MKKSLTISILLSAAGTASLLLAQQKTDPTFRESVEVRVMDLDVVVTDSKGQPVRDLKKEDFRVRIDGKDMPIDYFTRVEAGTIHAPDLAAASPDRVLAEYQKGGEAYVPRHFLIYVDSGHLSPGLRNRALESLRDFVTRLGPSDSARIVVFDRSPKTVTEWTTSKEQLLDGLSRMGKSLGMSRLMTEVQTLRDIDSTNRRSMKATVARSYSDQERRAVTELLKNLDTQVSTIVPLSGKKSILFVSGGFDFQPGYAMTSYALGASAGLGAVDTRTMSAEVDAVTRRANALDVTINTLDARGLTVEGASAGNDDPLASRGGFSFFARQDSQTGLVTLARETGGLALLNSNDLQKGLSRVYEESSTYYSLGVNLSKLGAAGYRKVQVDLGKPGFEVRARRGYAILPAEDLARAGARATILTNVSYASLPVQLRIAPAHKGKKLYEMPVTVVIPTSALTFLPEGDTTRASAEIYVGAIDDSGGTSDIGREVAVFTLPKDAPGNTPLTHQLTLATKKGNYRIVVNVRDAATGKMGTAKADIRVE